MGLKERFLNNIARINLTPQRPSDLHFGKHLQILLVRRKQSPKTLLVSILRAFNLINYLHRLSMVIAAERRNTFLLIDLSVFKQRPNPTSLFISHRQPT
jgi:hypothetical protein